MKLNTEGGESICREFVCPTETAFEIIGGKWRPRILWELCRRDRPMRFGELQIALESITDKILTYHLRELETMELIVRQEFAERPPRVEYSLSPFGKTLKPIFSVTAEWVSENRQSVLKIVESNPRKDWQVRKEPI